MATGEEVIPVCKRLSERIRDEAKGGDQHLVEMCLNIIKGVANYDNSEFIDEFEGTLVPVFDLLSHPKDIRFREDILKLVCSLVKRRKQLSDCLLQVLFSLEKVAEVNYLCISGDKVMITVNQFLVNGKSKIGGDRKSVEYLLRFAFRALFEADDYVGSAQAALLLQVIF